MRNKKIKFILILILITSIMGGCSNGNSNDNTETLSKIEEQEVLEYLKNNHSSIEIVNDNDFSDLEILDEDIEGKEIFFTGEYHGIKRNSELRMKFLKYFKEQTDFKYYLCELGYSHAYFINKYLETGDTKILDEMYGSLQGTFEWNKDNYGHWEKLYEYNKTLPEDRRIEVVGIDIEHQIDNAYRYLADVLPDEEAPIEIRENIFRINSILNNFNGTNAYDNSKALLEDMELYESIYREYLADDFTGFKLVNQNIVNVIKTYEVENDNLWNNTRDSFIYDNFKVVYNELPKGKFYGQWGLNHIYQEKENDIKWFAGYLNEEESEFKDKILSIAYIYDNCEQMLVGSNDKYFVNKINTISKSLKNINDDIGGDLNLYKINNEDSPFYKLNFSEIFMSNVENKSATDFYQYIICIKNSEPTKPLYK